MEGGQLVAHEAAQPTPMTLIQQAVQGGASVEQLQQLFELQLRYEANEAKKAFVTALSAFKADPPKIAKNKEVDFTGSTGKRTHYRHATLDNVCDIIGAGLAKHGLSYRWQTQQIDGGLIRVGCILTHVLGHSEEVWLQAGKDDTGNKNSIQAVGSTVTYLQRYTLLTATGMAVAESDDDARGGIKGLSDQDKAGFLGMVPAVETVAQWQTLWNDMSAATTKAGDVATHEEFRAAMAPKYKALTAKPKKEEGAL